MMSKHYTTVDGLFGSKIHYDENGNYAGQSVPGLIEGSMIHYDANGSYAGTSMPGLLRRCRPADRRIVSRAVRNANFQRNERKRRRHDRRALRNQPDRLVRRPVP